MRLAFLVVVAACGGAAPNQPSTVPGTPPAPTAPAASDTAGKLDSDEAIVQFCERLDRLTTRCKLANARVEPADCRAAVREALKAPTMKPETATFTTCVIQREDCDEFMQCIVNGPGGPATPLARRACSAAPSIEAMSHPVGIPKTEWEHRNGAHLTRFHEATSSKAAPIEVCGVPAETTWLAALRCDDGSQPIKNVDDAEHARAGSVGEGGRCSSIIDRYRVACPEQRYEIFIDAYICPSNDGR